MLTLNFLKDELIHCMKYSHGTEQGAGSGWPSLANACLCLKTCPPFLLVLARKALATLALGPEHSQSYNMHKTVVARQGEYGLSFILSLETPQSCRALRNRPEAQHGVNHELVQCKVQEEDTVVTVQ